MADVYLAHRGMVDVIIWWKGGGGGYPLISAIITPSRECQSHKSRVRQFWQIWVGRYYCIRHIFSESNFSRIGTSRHFREWLNSRLRRRAMDEEISIIHSFSEGKISDSALHMHCVLYYDYCAVHKSHSCVGIGGKYFCVLLNSWIAPDSWNLRK